MMTPPPARNLPLTLVLNGAKIARLPEICSMSADRPDRCVHSLFTLGLAADGLMLGVWTGYISRCAFSAPFLSLLSLSIRHSP